MSEKTTLIVAATPNPQEMDSVQGYLKKVLPLFMRAGGRLVKRLKVDRAVNGNTSGMVLVMDFDSAEAVAAMLESEDYAALIPVRGRGFSEMKILSSMRHQLRCWKTKIH